MEKVSRRRWRKPGLEEVWHELRCRLQQYPPDWFPENLTGERRFDVLSKELDVKEIYDRHPEIRKWVKKSGGLQQVWQNIHKEFCTPPPADQHTNTQYQHTNTQSTLALSAPCRLSPCPHPLPPCHLSSAASPPPPVFPDSSGGGLSASSGMTQGFGSGCFLQESAVTHQEVASQLRQACMTLTKFSPPAQSRPVQKTWNDEKPSSAAACAHQPSPSMFFEDTIWDTPYDGQRTPEFWGDELPFAPIYPQDGISTGCSDDEPWAEIGYTWPLMHLGPKSESAATASTHSHEELDAEPMSERR